MKTAFYAKPSSDKGWTIHGVFDTPEQAWVAALELPEKDLDLWFPVLPPDELPSSEMTSAEFKRFRVQRLVTA